MKQYSTRCLIFSAAIICFFTGNIEAASKMDNPEFYQNQTFRVWRVIDGDTFKISNDERVVLIGVDTPESLLSRKLYDQSRLRGETMKNIQLKGKLATKFTKQLLEGKRVRLRFDEKMRDKRGQLLAYVFLNDETFVNAEILKRGYGRAVALPPNVRYKGLFSKLEDEAKKSNLGLWVYESK